MCDQTNWILGRIILCCDFSIHHRHPTRHQRRFRRNVRETPRPRSERQLHRTWTTHRPSTPRLETLGQEPRQRLMYDVRKSRSASFRCSPRHAWEAVVQPIRSNRDARDVDTMKPTPAQEDDWDGGMAFQYHDGGSPRYGPDHGVKNLSSINNLHDFILSSFGFTKKPRVLIRSCCDKSTRPPQGSEEASNGEGCF